MTVKLNQLTNLEQAILKTLAYFDIFDYPLTAVELYKWLYLPKTESQKIYELFDVIKALNSQALVGIIESNNGFYFLVGRQSIIGLRLWHYQLAEIKFKIAFSAIRYLRHLAFIKMIAVCNTLGYNNATENSDIDFFIITKAGRLWYCRLVVTLMTSLLGLRRHDQKIADRICLSFYISGSQLNLFDITLKPRDIHLAYWLTAFVPVYDLAVFDQFAAANSWIKDYLPNFYGLKSNNRRTIKDSWLIKLDRKLDEFLLAGFIGDWLEQLAKKLQLRKMHRPQISADNSGNTNVVIKDTMLKFHENDRRGKYQLLWQQKIKDLNI